MPGRVNQFLNDIGGISFGGSKRPRPELGWRTDFEDSLLVEELLGSGAFGKVRGRAACEGAIEGGSAQGLQHFHLPADGPTGACRPPQRKVRGMQWAAWPRRK